MTVCRIFLCTYRRPLLLRRAIDSLLRQTCTDWICELHNDDPSDEGPRLLVEEINDPRIELVNHVTNLGPTRTFNLMYRTVAERYVALLEDDNWWQPDFLARMTAEMDARPEASMGWANMRVWIENADGTWTDSGRSVNQVDAGVTATLIHFPSVRQVGGALHSNGAMLVRGELAARYAIPESTTFAAVEPVRERAFRFPLLFVPEELANFSVTLATSRDRDVSAWTHIQVALHGSFLAQVPVNDETLAEIWQRARTGTRATNTLLLCGLTQRGCVRVLRGSTLTDWIYLLRFAVGRPRAFVRTLGRLSSSAPVAEFLHTQTALRLEEARARGFVSL